VLQRRHITSLSAALAARLSQHRSVRGETIPRQLYCFATHLQRLSDQFFTRLYRMCKQVFFKFAQKLTAVRIQAGRLYYKSSICMRLSITLRWLAGGSYLDISHAHGISVSCTHFYIGETLQDIDGCLQIKFPYRDSQWLEESSKGFPRYGRSPLHGCCTAMDELAIKLCEPSRKDVGNSSTYFTRKGFIAINLQAVCDYHYRFYTCLQLQLCQPTTRLRTQ